MARSWYGVQAMVCRPQHLQPHSSLEACLTLPAMCCSVQPSNIYLTHRLSPRSTIPDDFAFKGYKCFVLGDFGAARRGSSQYLLHDPTGM